MADTVHTWFGAAGYRATREACVPALATTDREGNHKDAYLDVQAIACDKPDFLIDVTVRHAPSKHYMPKAAEQDGSTFEPADKDKQRTYPARGGLRVTTFAAETYGRMSEPMLDTMRE